MIRSKTLALTALAWASAGAVQAADFVLQAPSWGAAQQAAVAAAGGSVRYSHAEGLAVASSDRADFLSAVLASRAISSGARDITIQAAPVRVVDSGLSADSHAPADTFYAGVQWAPQSVGAPAAWAAGWTGRGVRVAVIDGGIYGAHADLAANVDTVTARSFVAPLGADPAVDACRTAWNCDTGTFWHGTHVSGIIAAPANGIGVVGIAPQATIVPVKALHGGSGSFGGVLQAILYAATEGKADIINMSLGATLPRGGADAREVAELIAALNRAVNTAARNGVLVVSSAGNDALDMDHSGSLYKVPAESGNGLAISATGPVGFALGATDFARPASYTNFGSSAITIAAPGGDSALEGEAPCTQALSPSGTITRPCWVFDLVFSTARGTSVAGGYSWAGGTSMAAPAASAVAALIKQKYPGISLGALKARLANSATDMGKPGHDPYYGAGYLNAAKAVAD